MQIEIPYSPRPLQAELHDSIGRWSVVVCHRRFGKTVFAINHLIRACLTNDLNRPRYAYIAPTYKQAKNIAFDYLVEFSTPIPGVKINKSDLSIDYPNGGRISIYGADSENAADSLRGIYLDGCVIDEYAQVAPSLFPEVIRPALSDRKGFCIFIGTPKGKNSFYDLYMGAKDRKGWTTTLFKASETGIIDKEELDDAKQIMTEEEYLQEYECSWTAAIKGAVYQREVAEAYKDNRICFVPIEKHIDVHTFWDLGISDAMSIFLVQAVGKEIRIIGYIEDNNKGLPEYLHMLKEYAKEHGITYGEHFAPHDIEVRELTSGKSRRDIAREMGINFKIVPNHKINDGIAAARKLWSRVFIDETRCKHAIECLSQYHYEYDTKRGVYRDSPVHDWSSHCADAFRYIAMGWSDRLALEDRNKFSQPVTVASAFDVFE